MGLVLVEESSLDDVGLALQEKYNDDTYKCIPSDMGNAIRNIQTGGKDGQFFPMNMLEFVLPTMTLTYDGEEI